MSDDHAMEMAERRVLEAKADLESAFELKRLVGLSKRLKDCPFCGGEASLSDVMTHPSPGDIGQKKLWLCGCWKCGQRSKLFDSPHEALEAWNMRVASRRGGKGG